VVTLVTELSTVFRRVLLAVETETALLERLTTKLDKELVALVRALLVVDAPVESEFIETALAPIVFENEPMVLLRPTTTVLSDRALADVFTTMLDRLVSELLAADWALDTLAIAAVLSTLLEPVSVSALCSTESELESTAMLATVVESVSALVVVCTEVAACVVERLATLVLTTLDRLEAALFVAVSPLESELAALLTTDKVAVCVLRLELMEVLLLARSVEMLLIEGASCCTAVERMVVCATPAATWFSATDKFAMLWVTAALIDVMFVEKLWKMGFSSA
jgi:hypothetical protein